MTSGVRPGSLPLRVVRGIHLRGRAILDRRRIAALRAGRDVCWSEDDGREPLVTIRIPTHDRGRLIVERAIASALRQTYRNIEVLVVGDGATEETVAAIESVRDPRVRFVNLARGSYPPDPEKRWMVVGHAPMSAALGLARGAWIAPLDDDDECSDDRIEVLLSAAVERRLEFVYGRTAVLQADGTWSELGDWPPRYGGLTHGSVLYTTRLRFMKYDASSWLDGYPADWNLWRRMAAAGVRMGFVPAVVYRYYPARHNPVSGHAS